jgi:pyruvate dehydrogenase E2 component (dihydrolipoamide acetyltransferase)
VAEVKDVTVPDIGDFTDIPVIEILVGPGDTVNAEDPLITLESDKATMDVPAPASGVVHELKVQVGDTVSEGTVILTITEAVDQAASSETAAPGAVESAVQAEASAPPEPALEERETTPPPIAAPAASTQADAQREASGDADAAPEPQPTARDADGRAPYASPAVRRLARERGVDLAQLEGTGRKGRITKSDVEGFSSGPRPEKADGDGDRAATGAAIPGLNLAPWPTPDFEKFGPVERVALSRIKRISGPNLARNWVMIPHVTHNDEADITELEAFRKQINAEQQDVKVTMVALLLKACVSSLKAFPDVNASLAGDELVLKRYYHLGFAADTPNGLVVPVIRDVDTKGLLEIAGELRDLSGKARAGKLMPGDMAGGTFTISSLGGIGGTSFTPIVNAPEVAILGVTRSAMKPVWDGQQFVPRLMVPLSLSYDHRVIDGAAAARFTAHLVGVLSDMRRVLL